MSKTRVWTVDAPVTTDATSLTHKHDTTSEWVFIQLTGTIGTATVTPWVTFDAGNLPKVAPGGITYTTTGAWSLRVPQNAHIDLRTTGSGGGTSLSGTITSQQPY